MSTRRPPRARTWLVCAGVVAVVAGGVATVVHLAGAPETTVGGHDVSAEEYADYVEVVDAVDGVPGEPVRADVLQQIARDQALLDLARQAGLTDVPATPADLLAARTRVNEEHESAQRQGQLVYGAGGYGVVEFRSRAVAQLRASTIQALGGDERLRVTDDQVAAELAADPGSWSADATTYHLATYTLSGPVGSEPAELALRAAAAAGVDPDDAATVLPQATVGSVDVPGADLGSSGLSPDAQAALVGLAPGGYLDPQTRQGSWVLHQLVSVTRDDAAALEAYAPQIRRVLIERAFDELVDSTAQQLFDQN